ncbi:MAG TPA: transcriptional regulator PpsR [Polyangiaceae bacterium]|nr:transcriptional regulator PpsR [Polyangiaceae bacterium]
MLTSAADLALILDREGVILEVWPGELIEPHPGWPALVGRRWRETLAPDSQDKVEPLLKEASGGRPGRPRELNQRVEGLGEVPFRFSAVQLDDQPRVMALGRDLRPLADLQQRMVSSQQAMDREYVRLRQIDTRYRVLFQVSSEGAVVADAASGKVLEANPAAASMLGEAPKGLQGKTLLELFEPKSRPAVQALLTALEAGARPADVRAQLRGQKEGEVTVAATLFRQTGSALTLLRFWPGGDAATAGAARGSRMLATLDVMPEGFVVTDEDQRILCANAAFCELVQQANENQVIGQPLDRWLGRPGVDLPILLATLREHRSVRNFATIIRSDFGPSQEGLVTAVAALDGMTPCLGFTIRAVSSRLWAAQSKPASPRSVEQLRELVGRVPLKDLVRESADLIEKLCIEAALDVSGNNRASAAQLLGLSRQGLYSKLRRHGLPEFDPT